MPAFDLFAGTPDGVFAIDRRQRIALWNDGARRILGFEARSVLGRFCHEIVDGIDSDCRTVCKRRCVAFRAALRGELTPTRNAHFRTKTDGRKSVSMTTFVLPCHERSLLAHVFREENRAVGSHASVRGKHAVAIEAESLVAACDELTRREVEILQLLASGDSTARICARLRIQPATFRSHVQHVLSKLGAHSRVEAVVSGIRTGLVRIVDTQG